MLKKTWALMLIALLATLLVGCSEDSTTSGDDPLTPEAQFEAMAAAGIAYINGTAPNVITADDLKTDYDAGFPTYTVLDIRSETHYDENHIPGAYWTSFDTFYDDMGTRAFPTDKDFVVVCYTGQTAGQFIFALEMMGYHAKVLKFGMCGWNHTVTNGDKWDNAVGSNAVADGNVDVVAHDLTTTFDFPEWDTGAADADAVVEARIEELIETIKFKNVSYTNLVSTGIDIDGTVYTYPDDVFIVNYFGATDYMPGGANGVPGHLDGAYQFTPGASLGITEELEHLPDDGTPIVVYCWTGTTSSQLTAYLRTLGYPAYSLLYGSNTLWHDEMVDGGKKWDNATHAREYDVEPTP